MGFSVGDLVTAAESGDRAKTLEQLRNRLAEEIEVCESGRDLAALSRQLTLVLEALGEVAPPVKKNGGSFLDRLAERDAGRESGSSAS